MIYKLCVVAALLVSSWIVDGQKPGPGGSGGSGGSNSSVGLSLNAPGNPGSSQNRKSPQIEQEIESRDFGKSKGNGRVAMNVARQTKKNETDTLRLLSGILNGYPSVGVMRLKTKNPNFNETGQDDNPSINDQITLAFRVFFSRLIVFTESGANTGFQSGEDTVDKVLSLKNDNTTDEKPYSNPTYTQLSSTVEVASFCRSDKLFCLEVAYNNGSTVGLFKPDNLKFAVKINVTQLSNLGLTVNANQRIAVAAQTFWKSKSGKSETSDSDSEVKDNSASNTGALKKDSTAVVPNDIEISSGNSERGFFNFERSSNFTKGSTRGLVDIVASKLQAEDSDKKPAGLEGKAKVIIFTFDKPLTDVATLYWDPTVGANTDPSSAITTAVISVMNVIFCIFALFMLL